MGHLPRATTAAVFALAAATAVMAPTSLGVVDAACPTLASKDSTFMTSLAAMESMPASSREAIAASSVFARADEVMPFLTTCVAALDPMALMTQATTSTTLMNCMEALDNTPALTANMTYSDYKDKLCPFYDSKIIPCVVDGLMDIVTRAMSTSSSGGCCDALTAKFKVWTGNDLTTTVTQVLQHFGNIACAQRTITATKTTQYCGQAIYDAVYSVINATIAADTTGSLFNVLQIPNDQVCSALHGSTFTTTLKSSETLPIPAAKDMGRCFEPIDALIQRVRDYPLVKSYTLTKADGSSSVPLSKLFAAGECLQGDALVDWLGQANNPVMIIMGIMDAFIQGGDQSQSSNQATDNGGTPSAASQSTTSSDTTASTTSTSTTTTTSATTPATVPSEPTEASGETTVSVGFSSMLDSIKSMAKAFCFHLPNGATCSTYSDETIVYPYKAVATTPAPASNTAGTSAAPSAWSASAIAMALLAVTVSALAITARRT